MGLKKEVSLQIKNVLKEHPQGLRITDIVKKVKINRNTAGRYLENLLVSGQVEMRRFGMAKIYRLAQRVPLSALLSISSELVLQLDNNLRVIYANEPFLLLVGTDSKSLLGKNIEYTPVATLFDDLFPQFVEKIKEGIAGKQWAEDIILPTKDFIFFCRIAPTVFDDGRKGVSIIFEDVTEKKLAEKALQNSEMQYRSLVETTGTGYVIIDENGRVITANQEYVRLTGRSTLAEIEKRAVTDWTAPYDLERNAREIENCFRDGQVRDLEIDYQRPDRTIQPIEVNASVIQSNSGKIILTLCRDITPRRQAEQKVEESERQFRLLAENSLDMISRIKPDGTRIYVSPAYTTTLGYEPEELIGKNHEDFIHPDDAHVLKSLPNILRPDNPSATATFRTKHKNGHYIWIESAVKAIFDETTGELSEYYTVTRDITQRKKEQELLQESEDKYRKLVEISPDAVIIHREGKISYVNPAAVKLLGALYPDQLVGKNVLDTIHPDFHDSVIKNIEKDLKEEISPSLVLQMIRLDGTPIIVEGRGVRTSLGGKPAIQVALRDISESKRAENALRESEAKYRTFIDRANDGIVVVQEGIIKICNKSTIEFWGGSISDIVGKNFMEFIRPDVLPDIVKRYKKRMAGEKIPPLYETILKRKDGSSFFAELNAGLISFEGQPADLVIIRDINERKKIEEHLLRSENLYRTLAEASNDLIFIIDRNDRVEYVNIFASKMVNKTPEQIIGQPRSSLFPPDVVEHQKKALTVVFDKGVPIKSDGALVFGDQIRWFDHYLTPLRDVDNHVRSVLGISRDITERKRMEDALRDSEEKYRSLVNRAKDVVCIVQDGIIKICNPRLAEFWGGPVEEILGRNFADFIHPDALPEIIDRYNRRLAGESPPSLYETVFKRKDGSKSYVEVNAGIITYEGKNADLVIVRDINERKNAMQAIRESEERLRSLLDSTDDLIFLQDPEGRYLYFNAASMYGLPIEKVLGSTPYDLLDKESADRIVERLKTVAKTGQSILEETMFVWKGQTLWFSDNLSPVRDANGTITAIVTVSHNITDRKNSERALRESEEKYRSLVTTTGDIVWETDDKARFIFVSPQAESIIGFKPDELIGHTPFEFLKPDAIEQNRKMFGMAIENKEKSVIYISQWIHKNGYIVFLESHAVPVYRSDGSFSGFIGIDRKKML